LLIWFQQLYAGTQLLNIAPGGTADPPLVPLAQSSRTRACSSQFSACAVDRNRTVSRRSKPNSRTTLIGEQPNPWNLLQHQDVMSRHRGAKRPLRSGLWGVISLLSPAYLLSVERRPCLTEPSDHYSRLSSLRDLSVLQSSGHVLLRSTAGRGLPEPTIARLRYVLGGDLPSQTTNLAGSEHWPANAPRNAPEHAGVLDRCFMGASAGTVIPGS
jgi:hypothetical protein